MEDSSNADHITVTFDIIIKLLPIVMPKSFVAAKTQNGVVLPEALC